MIIETKLKNYTWTNISSEELFELNCTGQVWEDELLLSLQKKDLTFKKAISAITKMTGFFSLVYQNKNQLIASVDHIRSSPLFYGKTDNVFYLSDCAEWVREKVNDLSMDEDAKTEFQLAGYVTGSDTLYKNVKQLQAGECLAFINGELELNRYYRFLHTEPKNYKEQELLVSLDKVAKESIQRLIKYANGRQIVVPLSGGYDSRLIAALLKETGYENILTFTYGIKGNKEAEYSKKVADALGLKWKFIEYTSELWLKAWQTQERKDYQIIGSGWSSIPHIQDWLAVKVIQEHGIVEPNAVFVPGHTGDFISGGHIPKLIFNDLNEKYNIKDVCEFAFIRHYCLVNTELMKVNKSKYLKKILCDLEVDTIKTACEFADAYEKWEWQERQAKFIFNSVRVYEFFGYDWWVPLWDKEFVRFFECLPLELRNHEWYKQYVQDKYLSNVNEGRSDDLGNASDPGLLKAIADLKVFELLKVRRLLIKFYRNFIKSKDPLAIGNQYDTKETKSLISKGYSQNGLIAYFFIKDFQ